MTGVLPQFHEVEPLLDLDLDESLDAARESDSTLESDASADSACESDSNELDEDVHVGFHPPEQLQSASRPTGRWQILGAWGLSLLIHASIVLVAATICWRLSAIASDKPRMHAQLQFALGDTAEEHGVRTHKGADLPPGIESLNGNAISNGAAEPPAEAEAMPEPIAPPPAAFEQEPITESGTLPIVPPSESNRKLTELPAHQPPKLNLPAEEKVADTTAQAEAQQASATQSNATATAAKSSPLESIRGQGGATTGDGGSAITGVPGIRAGLRNGRKLVTPVYPLACRKAGEQGTVRLQIEVRADGSIATISVTDDAGYPRLAQAAVHSLDGFVFDPAMDDAGHRVADSIPVPYEFKLERPRK